MCSVAHSAVASKTKPNQSGSRRGNPRLSSTPLYSKQNVASGLNGLAPLGVGFDGLAPFSG